MSRPRASRASISKSAPGRACSCPKARRSRSCAASTKPWARRWTHRMSASASKPLARRSRRRSAEARTISPSSSPARSRAGAPRSRRAACRRIDSHYRLKTRSAPSPACGGGLGRGRVCTHEAFCMPPPYPSPASGGGNPPSARRYGLSKNEGALRHHKVEPPHACHLAAAGADACDRLRGRLERDRHVEGIGVNERGRVAHDGHVALPEHEIAPPQLGGRDRELAAERLLLHGAVARAGNSARAERDLQEARTVEAERRLAAPQIGRSQEALGDRDEIAFMAVDGNEMARRYVAAGGRDRERVLAACDGAPASEREPLERRQLDRRSREHQRAQRSDLVGRRRTRSAQRARGQEARIAVGLELAPRPAFLDLVHGHALALERLGVERRIGGGRMAQRRRRLDDFVKFTLSHSATPRARRARAPLGTRRPRAARAWWSGSRRRCRNAATPWPPRRTGARTTRQ